ncbi:rhamnogalacturonate lyase-like protein [Polyplosphaeria fusca]|uniref:rhamnogalacturonan endolyase n=1 Tax=Polyplosphaeria fusca TaxID=682080 RepID=A0A9P4R9I6_9PLEO|nr:rhamnogalacturonate lyase-like protein [Polyplosphaeria fusca]
MEHLQRILRVILFVALLANTVARATRSQPESFLEQIEDTTWVLGNRLWNLTQGRQYGTKLWYNGKDLVGNAVGHYVSYNGACCDLNWTSAAVVESGSDHINVRFRAKEGDFHWVIYDNLTGAYQYFVNHDLPVIGEFRTLWRLDNQSFPRGRTNNKDGVLPALSEYATATNVQDETWQKVDGSFLTKYDWSAFVREQEYYGVYGNEVGSWYIHPSKDYFNGNHLKQELVVHRESKTGDAVQLNMIHGTHYQALSSDQSADGKTWGPWLWYLNNGSKMDAAHRWRKEETAWPYNWFKDSAYQSRGAIQGRLVLSDGRPAAGAAVFLGDNNSNLTTLDQGRDYYYTTYADEDGVFEILSVRSGTYGLYAWSNGGNLAHITTTLVRNNIVISKDKQTELETIFWSSIDRNSRVFQIGDFDRQTTGFALSSPTPYEHGRIAKVPADNVVTVGKSTSSDWYFGQSSIGTHSIIFPLSSMPSRNAKLSVSLAGFSSGCSADILLNAVKIGNITTNSALLPSSQDTYRGATRAGEWHLLEFPVEMSLLKNGDNTLSFKITSSTLWRGWLWDSIFMDWV